MSISRRQFIKGISSASLVLLGGKVIALSAADALSLQKDSVLRFAVASDGHFGQPDTEFNNMHESMLKAITEFHGRNTLNFCVINGDLIHDQKPFLADAKRYWDRLPVKYFVTKGNHDIVSDAYWEEVWGMPVNHEVKMGSDVLLLATTSNEKGEYLSPDLGWMKEKLKANTGARNIFIFIHIPQMTWTKNGIHTPAFFDLIKAHKNVKGVFHGHEHDQDAVKTMDTVPYMFDSHIGGSWGTTYRGFRVVELTKDNHVLTYIMNPSEKINQASF